MLEVDPLPRGCPESIRDLIDPPTRLDKTLIVRTAPARRVDIGSSDVAMQPVRDHAEEIRLMYTESSGGCPSTRRLHLLRGSTGKRESKKGNVRQFQSVKIYIAIENDVRDRRRLLRG